MTDTQEFRLILSSAGSDEQAETIARALVERRVAACVNIVGQTCSVYHWEGEVQREEEKLLLIKTSADRVEEVRELIRELHTYDCPEFVSLAIDDGDPDYLGWLGKYVGR